MEEQDGYLLEENFNLIPAILNHTKYNCFPLTNKQLQIEDSHSILVTDFLDGLFEYLQSLYLPQGVGLSSAAREMQRDIKEGKQALLRSKKCESNTHCASLKH